jgi:hypothetical protein
MGIKCSLLGHQFAETDVVEEREEQGSEVVITIKEIETCDRCGAERIVSENKEVTSLETADGDAVDAEPDRESEPAADASGPSPSTGTDAAPDMTAAEDDAELLGEDSEARSASGSRTQSGDDTAAEPSPEPATDAGPETTADPEPEPAADAGTDPEPSAAEDDAVILDDGDDEPEREPGEWPDEAEGDDAPGTVAETDAPAEEATGEDWPDDVESEPDRDQSPTADMEWPDEGSDDDGDDWEPSESLTQKIDQAEVEPAGSATVTVPEGEFECPECGFRTSVESTSLRAGDFCPECHRGSLEHVPEGETRKE